MIPSTTDILPAPYQQPVDEVVATLAADIVHGLTDSEAAARLERYGRNELQAEPPPPAWRKFLAQFANVLVILLLAATAISALLWLIERDSALPYEAIAIFGVVLFNAILGYVQQSRAEVAVAALLAMSAAESSVVRGGRRLRIPSTHVVPGDLLLVEEGDTIPADARLIQSVSLKTVEAAITGESLPLAKHTDAIAAEVGIGDRQNMLFSGTIATYGRGQALVTATGMQTEIGRIARLLKQAPEEPTPLQKELDRVGKVLGAVVIVIALVMIGTLLTLEDIQGFAAHFDVLILGVALAVAAVPEGLPAIVTAVLAIGVQRMAQRKAIVRNLAAAETLGSATVIASDKTGTLTRNEMTVRVVATASGAVRVTGTGYEPTGDICPECGAGLDGPLQIEFARALTAGDLANNATLHESDGRWTIHGDPTEGALIVAARKAGLHTLSLDERWKRVAEVPFSSERKLMSTVYADARHADRLVVFTKGAPDVLLARCTREHVGDSPRLLTPERREEILHQNHSLAAEALRTLGVAAGEIAPRFLDRPDATEHFEDDLIFLGLIGMIDPPRDEARQAVKQAKAAGIRPVMITGDHPTTAAVIARELGIAADGQAVTGAELEQLTDEALRDVVRHASVYARVNPEHKLRIVDALQQNGDIVAMTGDGVNDAPALKAANIGIAMGITGTDVSKQAADVILTDDNFATIVAAVEEGRALFDNIRKFLRYLLSSNIGEVLTMFLGVLLADRIGLSGTEGGIVLPLLATQILWINLVTDGAPALALGLDPADTRLMARPPRPAAERVVTRRMWIGILVVGVVMAVGTLLALDASLPGGFVPGNRDLRHAQSIAFTTLMLFQLFNALNARSDEQTAFRGLFSNHWLWAAIGLSLALHMAVLHVPFLQKAFSTTAITVHEWLFCAAVASSVLWFRELTKLLQRAF